MTRALVGLLFGLIFCFLLAGLAGENPLFVAEVLFKSAFGSTDDLALTLFYTTSLIFTGLSVAIAFHSGLFNIGAEGQLTIGTMAATGAGLWLSTHYTPTSALFGFTQTLVAILAAILAGAAWGFIPGYFKVKRNAHEVILTMMMNFIAAGIAASFVVNNQNPSSQNPESAPLHALHSWMSWDPLHRLAPETPFNISFALAVLLAFGLWHLLYKTRWGFEVRATGDLETAAAMNGIPTAQIRISTMALAGALAALVAINEIFGSNLKYRLGFSPDYGFIGVAVALLARNNPLGILLSAFLFGALQKGAGDLDLETNFITRDFAKILQAILILSVSAFAVWPKIKSHLAQPNKESK